ncbi:hypothetical protein Tco_1131890 [Tanacetum coccineum]|uniref:Uncharacterized protein n=1 Tax=Tanacetum coccineum TaxID=301880 RepID=A0ABQ5JEI0_9ASTR
MTIIGTKWVFRNKLDENGIVSRNKASLEDSKPMKTSMSLDTKLTKDEECTTRLGLWYPKGTVIETVVYADSDHAGDYVDKNGTSGNHASFVEFECQLEINDQICPRFILEFYSQYQINYSDEGEMFIEFVIQNEFFSYSLEEFAQILDIPYQGACVFTEKWSLDELAYGVPTDGPYQTNPPSLDDIISFIRIDREGQVRRIRYEEEIDVLEYQVLTLEIEPTLKPLEEIIRENVFCLGVIRIMFPCVFVTCFIVSCTSKSSTLPISWQNE